MAFDGLKRKSARIIAVVMGIMFILFGTSWLMDFDLASITKGVIMLTVGLVLGIELGIKLTTNISRIKEFKLQQWFSLAVVISLFIGAVFAFLNTDPGTSLNSINNFLVAIGSLFIIVEAFN